MDEQHRRRLSLLTRQQCHLCEAARDTVSRVAREMELDWQELSVEDDPDLLEKFGEEIPVVFVDGVQRDFWHIDEVRLRRILQEE